MNSSQDPAQIFGYDVNDTSGNKVGKVDNVWVDDATNELEFVGVKTGWLVGKTHVIPVANAQISDGSLQVPFDEDTIKNAPSFSGDAELSPEQEDDIYSYYSESRSTSESPSGLTADAGADSSSDNTDMSSDDYATVNAGGTDYNRDNTHDDQSVTLHEEELEVGKRQVEADQVRLRKVVHNEHREGPVELQREEVEIERVPATGDFGNSSTGQDNRSTADVGSSEYRGNDGPSVRDRNH
jgi:stress response protein YsnF/sporulation protein YlmC with PRC-barrel domain